MHSPDNRRKRRLTARLATDAMLLALAAAAAYLEASLPPMLLPGAHIGLSHVVIMLTYLYVGMADAISVSLLRLLCVTLPIAGVTAFLFALGGSVLSFLTLPILSHSAGRIGLGIASAAAHCTGQIVAAIAVYGTIGLLYTYYPVLLLLSVPLGAVSGGLLWLLERKGGHFFARSNG